MNVCQVTALVRYYGRCMYATWQDMACVVGAVALDMIEPPENMRSGKIAEMLHADLDSARRFTELVPRIPAGTVKAFAAAPLDRLTFEPDMVVMYANTAQAVRVVQYRPIFTGGEDGWPSAGVANTACVRTSSPETYTKHDFTLAIPCFGDRKTALAQDEELTVAFPADMAQEILDGLVGTAKTAAYPMPMDIGFPQMPDYTLTDWAVAFRRGKVGSGPG